MTPPPPFARNDPRYAQMLQTIFARAAAAHRAGRLDEAASLYREVLSHEKRQFDALHMLAVVAGQKGDLAEGIALLTKAIRENPNSADAHLNLGRMQGEAGDHDNAVRSLKKAIALAPNNFLAHSNLSAALRESGLLDEALTAAERATALNANASGGWINRGNMLLELGRHDEARQSYERALSLSRDAKSLIGLGNAHYQLQHYREALAAFDSALQIQPTADYIEGLRLSCKAHLCDWRDRDAERDALIAKLRDGRRVLPPFSATALATSPADQLKCAQIHAADKFAKVTPRAERPRANKRIRVGYLSSDFHAHATAFLIAGLIERHDRDAFEIVGLSYGRDDGSAMRARLVKAFDDFVDISGVANDEAIKRIRALNLDVLIDLKGYTQGARPQIAAARVAPVQASYLGFPGTLAMPAMDYIIADATVIPEREQAFYTEQVVTLPGSYQVNDDARADAASLSRIDAGLPAQARVFCCFNNAYKITPAIFAVWMKILKRVPQGVLWLFESNAAMADNLRREAGAAGIDATRLIFAPFAPNEVHLARYRLADVFLDTLDYNAHTTASDALWMALPVVTLPGATFASRVAASLVKAAGTPETIVASLQDYEDLAVALATDDSRLAALRQKLDSGRASCALFDTTRFARHIEAAYRAMAERARKGEKAEAIEVTY